MESPQLWDQPHLLWIGLACLVVVFGLSLLINGWSMKIACRICGVDEIGFRYALLVAVVSGSAGIAASLAVTLGVSKPSAALGALAPAVAMVGTIALLVGRNPFRALGIYVLHSIIGTLLTLAVFVPLAFAAIFMIPAETMDQFSTAATEGVKNSQLLANLPAVASHTERMATPSEQETARYHTSASTALSGSTAVSGSPATAASPKSAAASPKPAEAAQPTMRSVLPEGVEQNPFVK